MMDMPKPELDFADAVGWGRMTIETMDWLSLRHLEERELGETTLTEAQYLEMLEFKTGLRTFISEIKRCANDIRQGRCAPPTRPAIPDCIRKHVCVRYGQLYSSG